MKLMLAATSGGHFATMKSLQPFWSLHQRVWVTDLKKDTEVLEGEEQVYWLPYQGPRDLLAFALNIPTVFRILSQEQPDLVISTGASISVSFALAAKVLGIRFIYIESISRSKELSLSGKLVYPLSDEFYVQWPSLCKNYPRATFKGYA
jgi:UDP-N-acetylglucosamine:LPS N-acetylglucosamine transferase